MERPERSGVKAAVDPVGPVGPVEAVITLLLAFVLLPLLGRPLQLGLGMGGVALTEILCVLGPVLLALAWTRVPASSALGLSLPPWRAVAGALLVGLGGFYLVAAGVESLQERVAPMSSEVREQLRRFIVPSSGARPLVVDLTVLALLPAVCEEAMFRGLLLRSVAPISRGLALLFTSLSFGAFHYSLYKFAPTAILGGLLGALALRSGSLVPALLAHALNNTVVVLLVRAGLEDPPATGGAVGRLGFFALAVVAIVLGLRLANVHARLEAPATGPK